MGALLDRVAERVVRTELWISDLHAELTRAEQELIDLRLEARYIEGAYRRESGESPAATAAADPSWLTLSGVDAVERALQESGPLHLSEIQDFLVAKGRSRLTKEAVSANLSHLRKLRNNVTPVGRGRWDYLRPAVLRLVESGGASC